VVTGERGNVTTKGDGGALGVSRDAGVAVRRAWATPMLTRIGSFGTIMQGGSKMGSESGTMKMT
jgi:hypothetical protein